jgi:Zn-dependent protease with chaperone function
MLRQRPLHLALLLAIIALASLLSAAAVFCAPAGTQDSTRAAAPPAGAVTPRRRPAPTVTDSARQAYRAWLRRLAARLRADSLARADGLVQAARPSSAPGPPAPGSGGAAIVPGGAAPAAADTLARARADSLALSGGAAHAPPRDYIAEVLGGFTPLNRAYATTQAALGFLGPLYGILIGLFILFSGISGWMRDVAVRLSRRAYLQFLTYLCLYLVVAFVLGFPLAFYQGFGIEHRYGLSNQTLSPWMMDEVKTLAVALVFFGIIPLVRLAYVPIQRFPRRWWQVLGLGTLPVIVAVAFLQPLVVDPLFNRFTPLEDRRLEEQILQTASRAGVPARHVFQMDGSRQTRSYAAYVTGLGPSLRVVLSDNLIKGMTPDEIQFVVGHEAGHYRLHHMWWGILGGTVLSFLLFWLCARFMRWSTRRWGERWGFTELHDIASMPLLVVALTLFGFLAQPAVNEFSRRIEHDSDTFALELTRANDTAARTFVKLGAQNRSNPSPSGLVELFEYSHPPLLDRVSFALQYRPWQHGRPNRLFKPVETRSGS